MSVWKKSKINLAQLRLEIRNLKPSQKLYRLLRDELSNLGYWKQRARWNPRGFAKKRGDNNEND